MLILVEGPKNVGKSHLIGQSKFKSYKFPFVEYFSSFIAKDEKDTGSKSKETYYFTTSYDVTLLSLNKAGMLPLLPTLIDRSFLSNIVLGVLQGRITEEEGYKYIDYLAKNSYLENTRIVYVDKVSKDQGKREEADNWEFLEYEKQAKLFTQYLDYLHKSHEVEHVRIINRFDQASSDKFNSVVKDLTIQSGITSLFNFFGKE
jgi:hypothetical protein